MLKIPFVERNEIRLINYVAFFVYSPICKIYDDKRHQFYYNF